MIINASVELIPVHTESERRQAYYDPNAGESFLRPERLSPADCKLCAKATKFFQENRSQAIRKNLNVIGKDLPKKAQAKSGKTFVFCPENKSLKACHRRQ